MDVRDEMTRARRSLADRLFGWIGCPVSAADVTRISAWCCLFTAVARFQGRIEWAFGFLLAALVLDVLDGVVARRRGENTPEIDWAADRFGEAVLLGAVWLRDPQWVSAAYTVVYAANVYLPIGRMPVLPLRQALGAYYLYRLLVGG